MAPQRGGGVVREQQRGRHRPQRRQGRRRRRRFLTLRRRRRRALAGAGVSGRRTGMRADVDLERRVGAEHLVAEATLVLEEGVVGAVLRATQLRLLTRGAPAAHRHVGCLACNDTKREKRKRRIPHVHRFFQVQQG